MSTIQIYTNQTVNHHSEPFSVNSTGIVKASGNFGGGTVNLQVKLAESNDDYSDTGDSFTEDFAKELTSKKGALYRLNLTGSTGASLNAFVENNF